MRVLMICPQFHPLIGGYERAAGRLSSQLALQGQDVCVVTERRNPEWPRSECVDGFNVYRLNCIYRQGWHSISSLLAYASWLLCHGRAYDVWHAHQYGTHTSLAVMLGKILRRPVVLKLTSSGTHGLLLAIKGLSLSGIHRFAHRNVSACLAVSEETALEARSFGIPENRIHLVGNGLNLDQFPDLDAQTLQVLRRGFGLSGEFVAIAVGRIAEEKNPLGLLAAWKMALNRLPQGAQLVWVGDGPLQEVVAREIEESGLSASVRLVGHSARVQDWLATADLFLLSSWREGLSNALLEAMASGLPSVATAVSGVRQLLEVNSAGVVVPVGDMDGFAEAIVALSEAPLLRKQMGTSARQIIEAEYSIERVAAKTLDVYEKVLTRA